MLPDVRDPLRWSRSAEDILGLAAVHPDALLEVAAARPALAAISGGRDSHGVFALPRPRPRSES